jgi:hypothetical protein
VNEHEEAPTTDTLATYSPDQPQHPLGLANSFEARRPPPQLIRPRRQLLYAWWGAPSGAPHCTQPVASQTRRSPQNDRHRLQTPETRKRSTVAMAGSPPKIPGYRFVGLGPTATGPGSGWATRSDLFGRCSRCGDLLSLSLDKDQSCRCGCLYKDVGGGRFGSTAGDDSIAVYRSV